MDLRLKNEKKLKNLGQHGVNDYHLTLGSGAQDKSDHRSDTKQKVNAK